MENLLVIFKETVAMIPFLMLINFLGQDDLYHSILASIFVANNISKSFYSERCRFACNFNRRKEDDIWNFYAI